VGGTVKLARYGLNIPLMYQMFSLTGHPILSVWYSWISRMQTEIFNVCITCLPWQATKCLLDGIVGLARYGTEYSIGVSIVQPDRASNIEWLVLSDQPDTIGMLI